MNPGANTSIELVAGRHLVIGNVAIDYLENLHKIQVTYNITEPGWSITKTHLAVVRNPIFLSKEMVFTTLVKSFPI